MTDSAGKPTIEELEQDKKDSRLISALLLGEYSHEEAGKILIRLNSHAALVAAASKWPRCCDLWQDSLGGMHCRDILGTSKTRVESGHGNSFNA